LLVALGAVASLVQSARADAAEARPRERQLTPEEIDAWLDSRALPHSQAARDAGTDDAEAPPPPPHGKGFVLESSIGVIGPLGALKNITPSSPWFGLRFGFEPLRWMLVFAETDLWIASTSYAHPPPPPRSFAFWNVGGGVRLTARPLDRLGLYLQGSIGAGRATEDVLRVYGYLRADKLGLSESAELGFEWYQVGPHLALVLHGGVRNYGQTLERQHDSRTPLAWLGAAGLRYTF
jgi:hypothetical protein